MSNKPLDKEKRMIEEQIFYNLMRIVQEFPQYSVAQHFQHVMRSKGNSPDPYFWTDKFLLKRFEDYKDELERELTASPVEEKD